MKKNTLTGIIPALYTCFNEDESVNYRETVRLAEWLVERGVSGLYLCGSTGSGLLLNMDERKRIAEELSRAVGRHVPIMVHVGAMATRESIELARHAAGLEGVRGISSIQAQYYPMSLEDHILHLSQIAAATDLPFYPYVFQPMVDQYGVDALIKGFSSIPHMAGIKAAIKDLGLQEVLVRKGDPEWQIFHAYDQCIFHALMIPGIEAAIGSTYNVVPELAVGIYDTIVEGDYARASALQNRFVEYWTSMHGCTIPVFQRYFLKKRGFDVGPSRRPQQMPSQKDIEIVEKRLQEAGFDIQAGGL